MEGKWAELIFLKFSVVFLIKCLQDRYVNCKMSRMIKSKRCLNKYISMGFWKDVDSKNAVLRHNVFCHINFYQYFFFSLWETNLKSASCSSGKGYRFVYYSCYNEFSILVSSLCSLGRLNIKREEERKMEREMPCLYSVYLVANNVAFCQ